MTTCSLLLTASKESGRKLCRNIDNICSAASFWYHKLCRTGYCISVFGSNLSFSSIHSTMICQSSVIK